MNSVILDDKSIVPSKVICVGRNYVAHIHELGNEIPDDMVVFNKPNSAISNTLYSESGEPLHYEGEICFIVQNGQFSGVGFGLDLTKRALQSKLKQSGLPWERAKSFDGAAVFSDFVSFEGDANTLRLELTIDGELIQSGGVDLMMYKPTDILTELKSYTSLADGDIVMTGTPKGVGVIKSGQVFEGRVYSADSLLTSACWTAV